MSTTDDIFRNVMSKHCGKDFDFCLIDFSRVFENIPLTTKSKCRLYRFLSQQTRDIFSNYRFRNFRDELIRIFADSEQRCESDGHRRK